MAEKPSYEELEGTGLWEASAAGQGISHQLGQRPLAVPRGKQHTEGWGTRVRLSGGDAGALDRATRQRAVIEALRLVRGAKGTALESGTVADAADIPAPRRVLDAEQASLVSLGADIAAAGAAGSHMADDAELQTHYTENRVQAHWRRWLLQTLHSRGYVFPGANQPPLKDGVVDMARESETETSTSREADAFHEAVQPYPARGAAGYVALTMTADRNRVFVYPWPRSFKGVHCRYDGHPFEGPPTSIPVRRDEHGVYIMEGVFCSPNCAMAFINQSGQATAQKADQRANLAAFVHEVLGDAFVAESPRMLKAALPLEELVQYGGTKHIAEWRQACTMLGTHHMTRVPPYVPGFVLNTIQSRDAKFLQSLATQETIVPPSSDIVVPAAAVPAAVVGEHMKRVAERQVHGKALYAEWLTGAAAADKPGAAQLERDREVAAAKQGFSDAGLVGEA